MRYRATDCDHDIERRDQCGEFFQVVRHGLIVPQFDAVDGAKCRQLRGIGVALQAEPRRIARANHRRKRFDGDPDSVVRFMR